MVLWVSVGTTIALHEIPLNHELGAIRGKGPTHGPFAGVADAPDPQNHDGEMDTRKHAGRSPAEWRIFNVTVRVMRGAGWKASLAASLMRFPDWCVDCAP